MIYLMLTRMGMCNCAATIAPAITTLAGKGPSVSYPTFLTP